MTISLTLTVDSLDDVKKILASIPGDVDVTTATSTHVSPPTRLNIPLPQAPTHVTEQYLDEIGTFLDVILATGVDLQQRNRKAIELHGQLDRSAADLEARGIAGEHVLALTVKLQHLMNRLLQDVFNIQPKP